MNPERRRRPSPYARIGGACLAALLLIPLGAGAEAEEENGDDGGDDAVAVPSFTVPTLDLPRTDLSGTGGLKAPQAQGPEAVERRGGVRPVAFTVVSVQHARGHRTAARGCIPRGAPLEGFRLPDFPGEVQSFTTCFRLAADRPVIARFDAEILDPDGRQVADAEGEVSFSASGTTVDYVVSWVAFPARAPGTFELVVRLDRQEVGRFPVEVGRR